MTVQLTLKHPPNTIVFGRVKEIIAGQTLTLEDGETGAADRSMDFCTDIAQSCFRLMVLGGRIGLFRARLLQISRSRIRMPPLSLLCNQMHHNRLLRVLNYRRKLRLPLLSHHNQR